MQAQAPSIPATAPWPRRALQTGALMLMGLVAGATFGIWAGYNPVDYPAESFVLVHQGAVRGLNTLLPSIGLASMLLVLALAWLGRGNPAALRFYGVALLLMVAAGLLTRFGNQPINALVMGWNPSAPPEDWAALRDRWWMLHSLRTLISVGALALLTQAVLSDHAGDPR